jgi:hypothetical protein
MFLLVIRLCPLSLFLPVCILMLCGASAFDLGLWVVDMNDIPAFGSRMMSIGLGGSLLLRPRNKRYLCIRLCLFCANLILNLMISHGLANVFVMVDLVCC